MISLYTFLSLSSQASEHLFLQLPNLVRVSIMSCDCHVSENELLVEEKGGNLLVKRKVRMKEV